MHQDDGLEGGAASVGQLMQRLLSAPAALQQGAAHHARRAPEARAEAEGDVRGRLGAAATRQVHLEPGQRGGGRTAGDGSAIVLLFFDTLPASFQWQLTSVLVL